jgi:hypothetical protein
VREAALHSLEVQLLLPHGQVRVRTQLAEVQERAAGEAGTLS